MNCEIKNPANKLHFLLLSNRDKIYEYWKIKKNESKSTTHNYRHGLLNPWSPPCENRWKLILWLSVEWGMTEIFGLKNYGVTMDNFPCFQWKQYCPLKFCVLCCCWCHRLRSCNWKWSQLSMTKNLVIKFLLRLTQLLNW